MPEEPLRADAADLPGGGRRRTDHEPAPPDPALVQFRADLLREVGKRDKEVSRLLNEKLDAHQKELLARFDAIIAKQDQHAVWIKTRDDQDAEDERQRHEQELRASILQGIEDKQRAAAQAWHDRWAKYVGGALVTLIGSLIGLLVYAGEQARTLRWDSHSQWLTAGGAVLVLLIVLIVRYGPI